MTVTERPLLSIIVPLYNEEESITHLHRAITQEVVQLNVTYELIFVNDGSKDRTLELATGLARRDHCLRVVNFRRNYGQTPAMAAGIEQACGQILVTMDGDLQNDPADIRHFLDKMNEGYDIVVGWRFDRQDKLVTRRIPSMIANRLIGSVTGVPIKDNGCSLKAFRADLIKKIPLYSEMHRFIPAMASIAGPKIAEIRVRHHARQFGQSKYGLSRIYKVLFDLMVIKSVTAFASRPLLWFGLLSLPMLVAGTIALGYTAYSTAFSLAPISIPIAGTGLICLSAAFILFLSGALGELVYKLGDLRQHEFARLTARVTRAAPMPESGTATL
jgi:glycosyltransferase involved in cell wall biosynthesis